MIPCPHTARCGLQPGGRHRPGSVAAAQCAAISRGDYLAHGPEPAVVRATVPTTSAIVDQYPSAGRSDRTSDGRELVRRHNPQTGGFVDLEFDSSGALTRISHQTTSPAGDDTAVWYTRPPDGSASVWERTVDGGVSEWWIEGSTPETNGEGFAYERRTVTGDLVEALTAGELGED